MPWTVVDCAGRGCDYINSGLWANWQTLPGSQSPWVVIYKISWPLCRSGRAFVFFLLSWAFLCCYWQWSNISWIVCRSMGVGSCWPGMQGPDGWLWRISKGLGRLELISIWQSWWMPKAQGSWRVWLWWGCFWWSGCFVIWSHWTGGNDNWIFCVKAIFVSDSVPFWTIAHCHWTLLGWIALLGGCLLH